MNANSLRRLNGYNRVKFSRINLRDDSVGTFRRDAPLIFGSRCTIERVVSLVMRLITRVCPMAVAQKYHYQRDFQNYANWTIRYRLTEIVRRVQYARDGDDFLIHSDTCSPSTYTTEKNVRWALIC